MEFTAQQQSIKSQYPHLSDEEIISVTTRTKFDNIKNMYPNLSDDEIQTLLDQAEEAKSAKGIARPAPSIPISMENIEQMVSGEYSERILHFLEKSFPFLDFTDFASDLGVICESFLEKAKQHPEFEPTLKKLVEEFKEQQQVVAAKKEIPAGGLIPYSQLSDAEKERRRKKAAATRAAKKAGKKAAVK